jgi:hypothetical protein
MSGHYAIVVRQMGMESWAWYVKVRAGHDGSSFHTVAACQSYYSRPDVAWRHAMNELELIATRPSSADCGAPA